MIDRVLALEVIGGARVTTIIVAIMDETFKLQGLCRMRCCAPLELILKRASY